MRVAILTATLLAVAVGAEARQCPRHSMDGWYGHVYHGWVETDRNILRLQQGSPTARDYEDSEHWFYQYGLTNAVRTTNGIVKTGIPLSEPPYSQLRIRDFALTNNVRVQGAAFRVRGERATPVEAREITLSDISNAVNRIFWSTSRGHYAVPQIGSYYSVSGEFLYYVGAVELDRSNTMIYLFSNRTTSCPIQITFQCPYSDVPLETLLSEPEGEFRRVDRNFKRVYLWITGEDDDPPTVVNHCRSIWAWPMPVPSAFWPMDGRTEAEREHNRILWGILLTEVPGFNIFTGEGVQPWRDGWSERNRIQAEADEAMRQQRQDDPDPQVRYGHAGIFVINRTGINEL